MSIALRKDIVVRLPMPLYERAKEISDGEYKSFTGFIRDLIVEKVGDRLTSAEIADGMKASHDFKAGKGVAWRKIKRG
ncbi:MAG: hypothetical protein WCI27_09495 [Candidatus Omnitrophota bacterium]